MVHQHSVGARRIELARGDITTQGVEMIGNAANAALAGGGGVDGAIHAAAGSQVMRELRQNHPGGTPTGTAVITGGGRLSAHWIAHAVGPIWRGGDHDEQAQLASAYRGVLRLADEHGARTVALAAISLGIYGYPAPEGARVALQATRAYLAGETDIELVRFVLRGTIYEVFVAALSAVSELSDLSELAEAT